MKKIILLFTLMLTLTPLCAVDSFAAETATDIERDYGLLMIRCVYMNDLEQGYRVEKMRNDKIDARDLDHPLVSFNDLLLTSKIITAEAGSSWLSDDWKMGVGEILLNRVASPEFPNTIEDCIYAEGQYYSRTSKKFKNIVPYQRDTELAWRLLNGERNLHPSVVFQANFKQGSKVYKKLYDSEFGYTYFCVSSHPELYK